MDAGLNSRIVAHYESIPEIVREDLYEAMVWAKQTLCIREGSGHIFNVVANKNGSVCCCFAKPQWAGDHCGRGMETGSEAVVMAVCEYLNGA